MSVSNSSKGVLSHEETMKLIKLSQSGDREAKNKLVEHNIGLIRSILRGFVNRGYEVDDLFQIGSIGLLKAIDKFDTSFNVKFSTYAVPMIVGEIKRFLRDDGLIKVSRSLKQVAGQAKKAEEMLSKRLGREPTINEISEEIGVDSEEIVMALEASYHPEYLYNVIHQDDGAPLYLIDKVSQDTEDHQDELLDNIFLKETLSRLKPRDRQIIFLRYYKDRTQTEVAKELGISQVQVSRIEKRIIEDMRVMMEKA
ncbi:MAG TPA: RNA polymerase sporulation sigma factor SigF [Tissierellaceae bacterium]|nr:RNA polymerase sporulation sigma factor SigF [Tissierellaceae bacterium]